MIDKQRVVKSLISALATVVEQTDDLTLTYFLGDKELEKVGQLLAEARDVLIDKQSMLEDDEE